MTFRRRLLVLGATLAALTACATAQKPGVRDLTPAERDSLSQILEPLLTAAGLWRGPADGCAAAFGVAEGETIVTLVIPHAPCRVKLVLTEGALTRLDRATLRVVLAHDLAHLQLGHPDARQQRDEERKQTEKQVGAATGAAKKAASFIPVVGGLVGKGIGTAKKAATAVMEAHGNPYLPEEERAADTLTMTYLSQAAEPRGCAFATLLQERLWSSTGDVWTLWVHEHPVSAERVAAVAEPCPEATAAS
jgi:hypothetical protein